jgi:hypothetical protein
LHRLEQTAAATLQGFYEPYLLSFSIKPGSVNVSSTCKCECECSETFSETFSVNV